MSAVETTTEAVMPSEAVTQPSVFVVRPAKKTNQNGKKIQKGSGNRKGKKKEEEHSSCGIL